MCPKYCVGYVRRSDRKQSDNHSFDTQRREILRLADRLGYTIEQWFEDDAVSAYHHGSGERPAMKKLLNCVLEEDIDAVIFYDESRVSRRVVDFVEDIWETIGAAKPDVKFYCASGNGDLEWDPNDPQTQMRLIFAREESVIKSRRAKDAQDTQLQSRERPGSSAPYGYKVSNESGRRLLTVDKTFAPIVYFIFYLASWGHSSAQIAGVLNAARIPSPTGIEWGDTSVDCILDRQVYIGNLVWNDRTRTVSHARKSTYEISLLNDVHEPIIPTYLWELTHGFRTYKKSTGNKLSTPNLLLGIAVCKNCGDTLKVKDYSPAKAHRKYVKYICPTCKGSVPTNALHSVLIEHLSREWSAQSNTFQKFTKNVLNQWYAILRNEEAQCKRDIKLADWSLATESAPPDLVVSFQATLASSESKLKSINELTERILSLRDDQALNDLFRRFQVEAFSRLTPTEQRSFVLMTVQSVAVGFDKRPKLKVTYRSSPFFALNQEIGCITEDDSKRLGGMPKAASSTKSC